MMTVLPQPGSVLQNRDHHDDCRGSNLDHRHYPLLSLAAIDAQLLYAALRHLVCFIDFRQSLLSGPLAAAARAPLPSPGAGAVLPGPGAQATRPHGGEMEGRASFMKK
jgi:hypothetical protein